MNIFSFLSIISLAIDCSTAQSSSRRLQVPQSGINPSAQNQNGNQLGPFQPQTGDILGLQNPQNGGQTLNGNAGQPFQPQSGQLFPGAPNDGFQTMQQLPGGGFPRNDQTLNRPPFQNLPINGPAGGNENNDIPGSGGALGNEDSPTNSSATTSSAPTLNDTISTPAVNVSSPELNSTSSVIDESNGPTKSNQESKPPTEKKPSSNANPDAMVTTAFIISAVLMNALLS